jgi:pimeloyl-ACP methyl ester carboxylesterase
VTEPDARSGRRRVLIVAATDGSDVRAFDEGRGPAILVVHPGLDDGRSWGKVAAQLSDRFRVVRLVRRHYRLDLPTPTTCSISDEVEDVLTLAKAVGGPTLLVGHSSGAVVALEALAASPGTFAGAVLFEPPVATGPPGPPADSEALDRAKAALADGSPGKAMQIFVRDVVGMPAAAAWVLRPLTAAIPRMRALAPRQLTDLEGVGSHLDAYAQISTPTVLLGAERSPAHLLESLDALATTLPHAEKVILPRRDHTAHTKAPREVAAVIETLANKVLRPPAQTPPTDDHQR